MLRVSRRFFFVASSALAMTLARRAHADATDDALRDLTAARAKLRTLVASFSQERVLALMSTTVTSHGELTLVRPDRLRWELKPPDESIYWVGPEGIAYRTPHGSGKVAAGSAGALSAVLDDLLVVLGGDLSDLKSRHTITSERKSGGGIALTLVPKSEKVAKIVRKLSVEFFADLQAAWKIEMLEQGDDKTTITFDSPTINGPVDPQKMKPS
jgi:hypothetical protein